MKKSILVLLFSVTCIYGIAQTRNTAYSKPAVDTSHPLNLTPARIKIKLAWLAVEDVNELANKDEYLPEWLEAKKAIREARAIVVDKSENSILNDIDLLLLKAETCRSSNDTTAYGQCRDGYSKLADKISSDIKSCNTTN